MVKHLVSDEEKCDACNGTGFPEVKQPGEPGRKIYPEPCKKCGGKGRIRKATWGK
ncbi:DnaJ-class molecular chaperone [Bradyrhizobium sp. USDA 4341]